MLNKWKEFGQRKVVLKVESEKELLDVIYDAKQAGLVHALVQDAGRTQVESGTLTVGAIGPANAELIDRFTGQLKLY